MYLRLMGEKWKQPGIRENKIRRKWDLAQEAV
jgi:ribosomal protein L32E